MWSSDGKSLNAERFLGGGAAGGCSNGRESLGRAGG